MEETKWEIVTDPEEKRKINELLDVLRYTSIQREEELKQKFKPGEKVIYEGETYDFGYLGRMGNAIIYEEGECNMQDAYAVDIAKLKKQ